jgi:hypothetical protein
MNSSYRAYDDLTVISGVHKRSGISRKRQHWFRESLNVRTYQDLADLSVDDIVSQLKADRKWVGLSQKDVEQWIAQVQRLAVSANPSSHRGKRSSGANPRREIHSPAGEGEWDTSALFVVKFQVRRADNLVEERLITVEHIKVKDGTWLENSLTGKGEAIEGEYLYQWMLKQLGEDTWQGPEEKLPDQAQHVEAPPTAGPSVKVEITQISVFQPPQSRKPTVVGEAGKSLQGSIKGGKPFALEVSFELKGEAAAQVAKRKAVCRARFYVQPSEKDKKGIHLGDTEAHNLKEDKKNYKIRLPEATLQAGKYRLWALVTLQAASAVPDFLEVPLFQVV